MYKYFGRLSGSTQAAQSLIASSPINANTPFDPLVPATKFIAYGEDANSVTYNRAFSALSANTDSLSSVLDSPALRYEVLEPAQNNYGNSALTGLTSTDVVVDLGSGQQRPVSWVFVGLHQSKLSDFIQLERVGDDAVNQLISPSDVRETAAGASYFANITYPNNAGLHGVPPRLVGVNPIRSSLPPYNGQELTVPVASWDADGCYLNPVGSYSWKDLYLQPGCFVFTSGGTGENSGLYRIASLTGGTDASTAKAVLTNAFTKVKISKNNQNEDVSINFPVGSVVSWRSRPNQNQSQGESDRTHRAYIMYVDQPALSTDAYLYLGTFSGGTDFPVQGSNSFKATPNVKGTETFNQFGLVELEAGANQNANITWSAPATVLHNYNSQATKSVVAVTPAGSAVAFTRGTFNPSYTIKPCSPPGFLLNPALVLPGHLGAIGGAFRAHCHVLTTVRDNLLSGGLSATRGSAALSERTPFGPGYQATLERMLRWIHVGDSADATNTSNLPTILSNEFGQTRQILGHNLYTVVFANAPANLQAGSEVTFQNNQANVARGVVAAISGTRVVFKDVVSLLGTAAGEENPISANYTVVGQNANVTVNAVTSPKLLWRDWGAQPPFSAYTPTEGLNAAYHADYSANPYLRGTRGLGNRMYLSSGRPITAVLPSGNSQAAFQVESPQQANGQDYAVIRSGPVGMAATDMALEVVDGTTLRIKDANAIAGVVFSAANAGVSISGSALDAVPDVPGMLGAINVGINASKVVGDLVPASILTGGEVSSAGGLSVDVAQAECVGIYGRHQTTPAQQITLPANSVRVVRWDGLSSIRFDALFPAGGEVLPIPLALVTTGANSVTSIVDLRLLSSRVNYKQDIYVGSNADLGFPSQRSEGAHFATVGAAVRFLEAISKAPVSTANWADFLNRRFRILVCNSTVEPSVIQLSSTLKGLVIEGFGEGAVIEWGAADTLFSLNGADDLVFRNIHLKYNAPNAAVSTTKMQRKVFYNSVAAGSENVLLDRVTVSAVQSRLTSYAELLNCPGLTIRDCNFTGATDVGVSCTGDQIRIENTQVLLDILNRQTVPADFDYFGLRVNGNQVRLSNCVVSQWLSRGIYVAGGDDVHVSGCAVLLGGADFKVGATRTYSVGIYVDSAASSVVVDGCRVQSVISIIDASFALGIFSQGLKARIVNNTVSNLFGMAHPGDAPPVLAEERGYWVGGNDSYVAGNVYYPESSAGHTEYGVYLSSDRNIVTGNLYDVPPDPAVTQYGIYVVGSKNIIDANQTSGKGISLVGANNSLGAMNRDDA